MLELCNYIIAEQTEINIKDSPFISTIPFPLLMDMFTSCALTYLQRHLKVSE